MTARITFCRQPLVPVPFAIPTGRSCARRRAIRNRAGPLAIWPTRRTRPGTFLAGLVEDGLLVVVSRSSAGPFTATFALTEKGPHAAACGEYEWDLKPTEVQAMGGAVNRLEKERKPKK